MSKMKIILRRSRGWLYYTAYDVIKGHTSRTPELLQILFDCFHSPRPVLKTLTVGDSLTPVNFTLSRSLCLMNFLMLARVIGAILSCRETHS